MCSQTLEQAFLQGLSIGHWPPQLYREAVFNSQVTVTLAKQDNSQRFICAEQ